MKTLEELRTLASQLEATEREAAQANEQAEKLAQCGGHPKLTDWLNKRRTGFGGAHADFDGFTKLLEDGVNEFGEAILKVLAERRRVEAHRLLAQAATLRATLHTYVAPEPPPQD